MGTKEVLNRVQVIVCGKPTRRVGDVEKLLKKIIIEVFEAKLNNCRYTNSLRLLVVSNSITM